MFVLDILVGAALLTLGRKVFWFFVAATGFYVGFDIATRYLHPARSWVIFAIAIGIGLLGALLAYFAQKLVIAIAGFLAGVFISSRLIALIGTPSLPGNWEWLVTLIAGIIGIALILVIFEWALIFFSSFTGAILIVEALNLAGPVGIFIGLLLFAAGLVFQYDLYRRDEQQNRATT